jgi:hypothetical protein
MIARIRAWFSQFLNRSSTINNEPLNKVSLIVIVLIDIFILSNVFWGLNDISQWHLTPEQTHPCYAEWQEYRSQVRPNHSRLVNYSYERVSAAITSEPPFSVNYPVDPNPPSLRQQYERQEVGHLGKVANQCLLYADQRQALRNPSNQKRIKDIDKLQNEIVALESQNQQIRSEYNTSLLERIAGQPRDQSINLVAAEKAKQTLAENSKKIKDNQQKINQLKIAFLQLPQVGSWLNLLNDTAQFNPLESSYRQASFWYPSIQLGLQSLFLLPLFFLALALHRWAQRKNYGLIALISWHLLVIFSIPLLLKVFEFFQIGIVFKALADIVQTLLGGLLFLVSYVYILLIPLLGFGVIKFFQSVVFNPKVQAASRAQKSRCLKCARKIRPQDVHCPHCGYEQCVICHNCQHPTYKYLPYCKDCGQPQDLSARLPS